LVVYEVRNSAVDVDLTARRVDDGDGEIEVFVFRIDALGQDGRVEPYDNATSATGEVSRNLGERNTGTGRTIALTKEELSSSPVGSNGSEGSASD